MQITPLGDSALTLRWDETKSWEETLREVADWSERIRQAQFPAVREVTTAFRSVAVSYDPAEISAAEDVFGKLAEDITNLAPRVSRKSSKAFGRVVEIPVCYDREFAPDLGLVAAQVHLTEREVAVAHASATYRVGCLGFAPGFPYLMGLPRLLATPRRATPRTQVPAGSVAIGGMQTGIYPQQSPGGWNVIGRTPLRLFEVRRARPALLEVGDLVRFRAITRTKFAQLARQHA